MNFATWNPEVVIWAIAVALSLLITITGLRRRSNAKAAVTIGGSIGHAFGALHSRELDDFDRAFNATGELAARQGLHRAIFGLVVLLLCMGYLVYRNHLLF